MGTGLHANIETAERHAIHSIEVADAAARTGRTYTSTDIGRVVLQLDDDSYWVVQTTAPAFIQLIDIPVAHATEHESGGGDEIDLGSLAGTLTDGQHGARGGGTLHADATSGSAGFMPAADKIKIDAITDTGSGVIISVAERNGISANAAAILALGTDLSTNYQALSEKGAANGYAPLDSGGKVPASYLPLADFFERKGDWNADTNTPTLSDGVGDEGDAYLVTTAGTTSLDGIADWGAGDIAVFLGGAWRKIDNTDAVNSVCGKTGTVTLNINDLDVFGDLGNLASPADSDRVVVEDADDSDTRKYFLLSALATYVQSKISGLAYSALQAVSALTGIGTNVDGADLLVVSDTSDSGNRKSLSITNLASFVLNSATRQKELGEFPISASDNSSAWWYIEQDITVTGCIAVPLGGTTADTTAAVVDRSNDGTGTADVLDSGSEAVNGTAGTPISVAVTTPYNVDAGRVLQGTVTCGASATGDHVLLVLLYTLR